MTTQRTLRLLATVLVLFALAIGAGRAAARSAPDPSLAGFAPSSGPRPASRDQSDTTTFDVYGDINDVGEGCCSFGPAVFDFGANDWLVEVAIPYNIKDAGGIVIGSSFVDLVEGRANGSSVHNCTGAPCAAVVEFGPLVIDDMELECGDAPTRGSTFQLSATVHDLHISVGDDPLTFEIDAANASWVTQIDPGVGDLTDVTGCTTLDFDDLCTTGGGGTFFGDGVYVGSFGEDHSVAVHYNMQTADSPFEPISFRADADQRENNTCPPTPLPVDENGFQNFAEDNNTQRWQGGLPDHRDRGWQLHFSLVYTSCHQTAWTYGVNIEPDGTVGETDPGVFRVAEIKAPKECLTFAGVLGPGFRDFLVKLEYRKQFTDGQGVTWRVAPESGIWAADIVNSKLGFGDRDCHEVRVLCPSFRTVLRGPLELIGADDIVGPGDWGDHLDRNWAHVLVRDPSPQ